jgi:hypothetical protein
MRYLTSFEKVLGQPTHPYNEKLASLLIKKASQPLDHIGHDDRKGFTVHSLLT